jgi:hypothetical protein
MTSSLRRFALAAALGLAVAGLTGTAARAQYFYPQPAVVPVGRPTVVVTSSYPYAYNLAASGRINPYYSPAYVPGSPRVVQYGPAVMISPTTVSRPFTTYNSVYAGPSIYTASPLTPPTIYTPPTFYTPTYFYFR